ncbi:transcriptional regulator, RpiR family [Faunimonas pinastri]|uniref:Transcriptional regulator, RpiR family n=1 Tax=Faunimonas pinastri TaxID=1855383 RepID=A0A1H9EIM5_9HYPH|nr:MurR/RpiR family transcriptional regulator [Faunimonas pinastri]SEQ25407.1 transcriptional regulator, RpiR family [Faunimonas pinastri]
MQDFSEDLAFEERAAAVNLFPAERRIVQHLLGISPYELGVMTSSDLSERSGASRSSIDRLSRKLGYPGLKEMRKALLAQEGRRHEGSRPAEGKPEGPGEIAQRVMLAIAARAEAMGRLLADHPEIGRLTDWLAGARNISLFGAGESAAICNAIYMRLVRLGLPISFAEEHHTQVTLASLMGPGDVALAISYSGATRSTLWAAQVARQNGARLVGISGAPASALARQADLSLHLPTGAGLPGSAEVLDRVVAVGLAEALFQCLVNRDPQLLANSMKIDDTFGDARA